MEIRQLFMVCVIAFSGMWNTVDAHSEGNYRHSDIVESLQEGDKLALLIVHFGTTHDDTRRQTIDAFNQKVQETFPDMEVREAYTSRIIRRKLAARNINKQTPLEALAGLKAEGYTHVVIQSTNIIDGIEMESLRKDAALVQPLFKEIRIGTPLLYAPEDYKRVIGIITRQGISNGMTLLVGHGTHQPETAQYAMLDYMLQAEGHEDFTVGTVEGYPSFDDAVARIRKNSEPVKYVQLVPFMFVAGDHAKNDIANDMKQQLETEGFQVSVRMEGLGQLPEIRELYIDHLRFAMKHQLIGIQDKKKAYAAGKDVDD